ncbi:MAG: molybdopterin-dependent oxidoreductase [Anaerolineales bacterium]|nr:molybdopterin-dependent oxidoreductase [Anaerolineales bacterium]
MPSTIPLNVNGNTIQVDLPPEATLLTALRQLGLTGVKAGCREEECGACSVLIDGRATPSCHVQIGALQDTVIITIEGLGTPEELHPLQHAFIEEQVGQCGFCTSGMLVAAQGLLNQFRYPTDEQIREGLAGNLCRCGVYERVRRAIKLRVGRPEAPLFEVRTLTDISPAENIELPSPLIHTPGLDAWIRIDPEETITVFSGKVEIGQGLKTALAQIAADELDVRLAQINIKMADTALTPDEGITAGSMSLQTSGNAIRYTAAEARQQLLRIAYEELEAPLERLMVAEGRITDPETGRSVTYWELFGGKKFGVNVTGATQPKSAAAYTLVGQPEKQLEITGKVTGTFTFIHDLDLPDMLHALVIHPPTYNARLVEVNAEMLSKLPEGVQVVRDGSFLAVAAAREHDTAQAHEALKAACTWKAEPITPEQDDLYTTLRHAPSEDYLVVDGTAQQVPIPEIGTPAQAAQTLHATYTKPYHMHASLGPSAAVAWLKDGKLTVWAQTQGVFPPRANIAHALGMPEADIHVIHVEGAGCYGHNGADDAAFDAALIAAALPGHPVSLKWSREDEHRWEPYSPATVIEMQASLDAASNLLDWNHDIWSPPHFGRPNPAGATSGLISAWRLENAFEQPEPRAGTGTHSGSHRNADPFYNFPARRIAKHVVRQHPLRISSFRGLGAFANVFAIESFLDELAHAANVDLVEFRLRYLNDRRARAVLLAAAEEIDWESAQEHSVEGHGKGIAFARYKNSASYAAIGVEVSVNMETGKIKLERAVIAADAGQVVNPDGLSNQLEGAFVQAASMTLLEEVTYDENGITSTDWKSYPIMRFPDVPIIQTVILNRPGLPFLGSGEAATGPTPAAIANAVFNASGIRLRGIPFTPERVLQAATTPLL